MILKRDGSEFHFAVGSEDEVDSILPANLPVAHLHTHSQQWAHSEGDWPGFLAHPSIEQTHVVTLNKTYSLHKPAAWDAAQHDLSPMAVVNSYDKHHEAATNLKPGFSAANETHWSEEANRRMAVQYGVNFRIGKRGDW